MNDSLRRPEVALNEPCMQDMLHEENRCKKTNAIHIEFKLAIVLGCVL